mgnify:CR=1 FL=1
MRRNIIINIFEKEKCSLINAYCKKDRLDMLREVDYIVINEIKKNKKLLKPIFVY